jgi:3-oxoacyl-[acyl-carrier protein] reductase
MKPVAMITGGTRGIGLGIAIEFAGAGFDLAINGRRPVKEVEAVILELQNRGCRAVYLQGDVADEQDRRQLVRQALIEFSQIHVLVNNAGVAPDVRADILEATEMSFDKVMSANLKGPYFLTQLVARQMIAQKNLSSGTFHCIINISSVSATVASVNRGEYCISKAGIAMSTRLWASRLGEFDIPVYEIQPGVIATDMTAGVKEKYDRLFSQGLAIQSRWGMPEDVGKVAVSMALGNMPYSTGQVVVVDGGLTIPRL